MGMLLKVAFPRRRVLVLAAAVVVATLGITFSSIELFGTVRPLVTIGKEESSSAVVDHHIPTRENTTNSSSTPGQTTTTTHHDSSAPPPTQSSRNIDTSTAAAAAAATSAAPVPPVALPLIWSKEAKRQIEAYYLNGLNTTTTTTTRKQQHTVMVGDLRGILDENGRLSVEVDESYALYNHGQSKLCQLLRDMTLESSLDDHHTPPAAALTTNTRTTATLRLPPPLLNLTINCEQLRMDYGQGNWITALYCVRLAVALANVDYQFQCTSGRDSQMTFLLPWFDGYYPAAPSDGDDPWPYDAELPTQQEVCTDDTRLIRVDKMSHEIQKDIQRMAVALVGPQHTNHQDKTTMLIGDGDDNLNNNSNKKQPLIANVTLDDVAIHFRCGDIMGGAKRGDYGMIKFTEYPKWIWNDTRSIGILTQPFDKSLNRGKDRGKTEACREAVYLLVDYLKKFYPTASINIHNSREETLPLTFARIAMAKQSFTTLSSFGIFPVVGTFGEGYFQKGNRGVNPFATYIPNYLPNLHEMNAPVKSSAEIRRIGLNATLDWFVTEDADFVF